MKVAKQKAMAQFIKIESLAGQDNMSVLEVTGWVLFSLILILLSIPVFRAILKIMKTCHHNTDSYTLESSPSHKESEDKYRVTYVPSLPKVVKDTNPSKVHRGGLGGTCRRA